MIETSPEDVPGRPARDAPVHVVVADDRGGVALAARQIAAAAGAPVLAEQLPTLDRLATRRAPDERWHVHFTDHALAASPAEAAERVRRWRRHGPLTLTLHDVPQAWSDAARHHCYREVLAISDDWVVSSHHEARMVAELTGPDGPGRGRGHVIPLPVAPGAVRAPVRAVDAGGPLSVGLLGWIYPDKGHREVVAAAGRLARFAGAVRVDCLGGVVPGHEELVSELRLRADRAGVELRVSGFLPDDALASALARVHVPVAAHRHLSASGSINSWIAAGRRPLVTDGRYARELAALRPGTLHLVADADLDRALLSASADPDRTWLAPGTPVGPLLADVARAYQAWWSALAYDGPAPSRPVVPPL